MSTRTAPAQPFGPSTEPPPARFGDPIILHRRARTLMRGGPQGVVRRPLAPRTPEDLNATLTHAVTCRKLWCSAGSACTRVRLLVAHVTRCTVNGRGCAYPAGLRRAPALTPRSGRRCTACATALQLLKYHASVCTETVCPLGPLCAYMKSRRASR